MAVAAVIGDTVTAPLLHAVVSPTTDHSTYEAALITLETRNFLYQQWGDVAYHFYHALTREVAYSSMAIEERQRIHRRVGELLTAEEGAGPGAEPAVSVERLAHHFYQSVVAPTADGLLQLSPTADGQQVVRAIDYLRQAGGRAHAKFAARAAIQQLERARSLLDGHPAAESIELPLLEQLGAAYELIPEFDRAITLLTAVYERSQAGEPPIDPMRLAALARRIGRLYEWQSDYPTALQWMARGLAHLPAIDATADAALPPERSTAAALHVRIGCVRYSQGNHGEAVAHCETGLALTADLPVGSVQAEAHNLLGSIRDLQGNTAVALRHYQQSLAIYNELGNAYEMARVENNLALIHFRSGAWAEAKAHFQRGIAFWEEIEDQYNLAFNRLNLGVIEMYQGEWAAAEAGFREALAIWGQANNQRWCALCHTNLGLLYSEQQRWDDARHHLEESRALSIQQEIRHFLPEITYALGEVALGEGDPQNALELAEEAIALATTLEMPLEQAIGLRVRGQAQLALHDLLGARQSLQESLALLQAQKNRYEIARTLRQLHRLAAAR
ncbi:MAG: tetratricopeptide repeat protein [Caldilineaceae bacterium]